MKTDERKKVWRLLSESGKLYPKVFQSRERARYEKDVLEGEWNIVRLYDSVKIPNVELEEDVRGEPRYSLKEYKSHILRGLGE